MVRTIRGFFLLRAIFENRVRQQQDGIIHFCLNLEFHSGFVCCGATIDLEHTDGIGHLVGLSLLFFYPCACVTQ